MRKKRILMCAESSTINSGFGRYTKEILTRLNANHNYEIAELSSYASCATQKNVPWKVYPVLVPDNDPRSQTYKNNPINQFGYWRFDKTIAHFRPDIVFDIRDYWMFAYQEISPFRKFFHWVVAPTVDSIPQRTEWLKTFENADYVLTHTDWARDHLLSLNRKISVGPCVTDSVDTEEFKPISHTKAYHKMIYGLPSDSIIIGSVMRNQKRKLIPALFQSLKKLIDETGNDKIFLYLHTSFPEGSGWDLPDLLQEYGVYNNVLFTYYCKELNHISVSTFKGVKQPCHKNPSYQSLFPNVVSGVTNAHLKEIYNLFDIYVQYAICEGLGIPQLEAASCGVPIMAVNYSGMEEITTKVGGIKINYVLNKELETGADRAVPDNDHLVSEIKKWMSLDNKNKKEFSKRTRELLVENYSWDKTAQVFMNFFDKLEPKNIWHEKIEYDTSYHVDGQNKSNREFVNDIINNVLKEPFLLKTHQIQSLIKNLDDTYIHSNGTISPYTRNDIVKTLESFLNNKVACEKMRNGEIPLEDDFLSY